MAERESRWTGPSYFDDHTESYGEGVEPPAAAGQLRRALREMGQAAARRPGEPVDELLEALRRLTWIEEAIGSQRALLIAEASFRGASWERMASASGVTRQSLHKRFNQQATRLITICTDSAPDKARRLLHELHPAARLRVLAEKVRRVPRQRRAEPPLEVGPGADGGGSGADSDGAGTDVGAGAAAGAEVGATYGDRGVPGV